MSILISRKGGGSGGGGGAPSGPAGGILGGTYPNPSFATNMYGTSLPGSPVDAQEYTLVDSTTSPTYQWRFRYNAGSALTYKWEFVGGVAARAVVNTQESTNTQGSWLNLATDGPLLVAPLAGSYTIQYGADMQVPGGTGNGYAGIAIGNGAPNATAGQTAAWVVSANGGECDVHQLGVLTLAASDTVKLRYYNGNAGTMSARWRWIELTPVRVS